MKIKILFGLIVFLSLLLTASAFEIDYTFKKGEKVDVKVPCLNNNTLCSSVATCNITIFSPDGSLIINNQVMTNSTAYFNYSLNESHVTINGDYPFIVYCQDGDFNGYSTLGFTITTSGTKPTTAQGMVYVILIVINLIILIVTLLLAININSKNEYDVGGDLLSIDFNKYLKMFLGLLSYFFFTVLLFLCWRASTLLALDFMADIFRILFIIAEILTIPIFLIVFYFALVKWLLDLKLWKLKVRGLEPR